jgi:hypothetical protein
MKPPCSFGGCSSSVKARGLCDGHLYQDYRGQELRPIARFGSDGERVFAKIDRRGPDECWLWRGRKTVCGYGEVRFGGKSQLAPRVVYSLAVGPIPDGLYVLHRCDNPPCCNPAHLFVGTQRDNVADMMAKGRGNTSGLLRGRRWHVDGLESSQTTDERVRRPRRQKALP